MQEQIRLERHLRPRSLLAGVVLSFLGCCLAGRLLGCLNVLVGVERFHIYLTPSALFYPTVAQLRSLCKARLPEDKVAVVVGGSSRLFGSSQRPDQVWTRHLQEQLGPDYQVINLGIGGGQVNEFGAIAAEAFDHPRTILIADASVGHLGPDADGWIYRYLFWDAHYKRQLQADPDRAQAVQRLKTIHRKDADWVKLHQQMQLDAHCRFVDLWNAVGYRLGFTVWTGATREHPFWPRRKWADPERPTPVEQRYPAQVRDERVNYLRLAFRDGFTRTPAGDFQEHEGFWKSLEHNYRAAIPAQFRPRTLIVSLRASPYYVGHLAPVEQQLYDRCARTTAGRIRGLGFPVMDVGGQYAVGDYLDYNHLSEEGGQRLAGDVAPEVRRLARALGYFP